MRWWRVFIDKLTGRQAEGTAVGPRRRASERFAMQTQVEAKCGSWPKFVGLFTGDVSAGGMYIPTDEAATIGETISVQMTTPDGERIELSGTVVNVIDAEQAAKFGRHRGLGVRLDPPKGEARAAFDEILAAAQGKVPVPPQADDSDAPEQDEAGASETPSETPSKTPRKAPAVIIENPIVGIDLGTSYTSVACVLDGKVTMCEFPGGDTSSPSVVAFPDPHTCIVGEEARLRLATDPLRTVSSPKRLLGRSFDDREIQGFLGSAPYQTLAGPDESVTVKIGGQDYAITQLIAYILGQARDVAEATLGTTVKRCVMTCPVSFDEKRTKLLRRAGQLAGLEVVALIDEPSAAALANRFDPNFGGIVGVYDFGGGTFDFSLVDVSKGDFVVLATAGDSWLGGDDLDTVLAEAAANQFWREHDVDLRKQAVEWHKLLYACERAKRTLSQEEHAEIFVPDALRKADGMIDLRLAIDRAAFEKAGRPIIDRTLATCDQTLELLDIKPTELTKIYLSGGTTYVPAVRSLLAEHFGVPVYTGVRPEHAVCLGAAMHAAQLQSRVAHTTLDERDD